MRSAAGAEKGTSMISMRQLLALLAVPAVLLASACGGEQQASSTVASAELAPRDAAVWASVDTDRSSPQWEELNALLARVPGAEKALDDLLGGLAADAGLDDDFLSAVGPELVATVPGGSSGAVLLVRPEDEAALRALVEQKDGAVTTEVEGWTAVGESQEALDAYLEGLEEGTLADDGDFREATADLPEDALARIYVDGEGLTGIADRAAKAGAGVPGVGAAPLPGATGALGRLAVAVSAEADGLRLTGRADPGSTPESFVPTLLERVPADALAAAVFQGGDLVRESLEQAGGTAGLGGGLEVLGISLEDIAELFAGQGVLYVRPGTPIPEVTLALEGAGARGDQVLGDLVDGVGAFFSAFGGGPALQPVTTTEDGVRVTALELQPGVAVRWASVGGTLVVTTGAGGIRAFRGDGAKLPGSDAFARAAADVQLGDRTSGFLFADVDGLVPLLEGLAELGGDAGDEGFDEVVAALEAIDSVAVDAAADSGTLRFDGFVRVR